MIVRHGARFTVRDDAVDEVHAAIRAFVEHTRTEPGTLRYESISFDATPNRFLHLMEFADEDAERAHASSDAVRRFTEVLYPLCTEGPEFEDWSPV